MLRQRLSRRPEGPRARPRLEILEDRAVPATFTVNSTLDDLTAGDGKLTFREAITRANDLAGADVIVVPAGVYKIAIAGAGDDANLTGDLDIAGSLTIQGAGAGKTVIDGQQLDRVFDVSGSAPHSIRVVLQRLTVRNGNVTGGGGGVQVGNADLVVRDCVVGGNRASVDGGGISNVAAPGTGNVKLVRTTVARNVAGGFGGGLYVVNSSLLTVNSCTVRRNVSSSSGGGVAATAATLTNSTVSGNITGGTGGGFSGGTATLTNSTVSGNRAGGGGGGINASTATLTSSTVSGNNAGGGGGGGIFADTATLTNSTVSGNSAAIAGGGLVAATHATLTNSTVSGNSAGDAGGGIFAGTATLTNSTVSGNSAGIDGGGIFASTANLTNSIVSGNSAAGLGGGIEATTSVTLTNSTVSGNHSNDNGGGIEATTATLTRCTVSGNSAVNLGGGILANTANLTNSTVSGNSAGNSGGGTLANTANLTNSTVSGNFAGNSGGGISANTTATLTNSTVSGNSANSNGGGILAFTGLTLTNSTVSGNSAGIAGGGIWATSAALRNCTVVENIAHTGGGLFHNPGGTFNVQNTIVALNLVDFTGTGPDVSGGFTSGGHNLIGIGTGGTGFTNGVNGDIVGTGANPVDPMLGALKNNGGKTKTHALLTGSKAIDAGDNAGAPATDQRGIGFPRKKDGNFNGIAIVDIGAFER